MKSANKKNKKILCLIGQLGNGGTEKQLYLFLKYLDRTSFEPSILVSGSACGRWLNPIQNLKINIQSLGKFSPLSKILSYKKIILETKPDIIFSWSFFTNAFCLFSPTLVPFVGSLRGDLNSARKNLGYLHWKLSLLPKIFVVNSNHLKKQLLNTGNRDNAIWIVNNIFDPDEIPADQDDRLNIREKFSIPMDAPVILGIGRDCYEKNLDLYIDVFKFLKESDNNIYAFLLGNSSDRIVKKAKDLNLLDRLFLPGEVENPFQFYRASDIFFLSSRTEGSPNCILESLACGLDVFIMDIGEVDAKIKEKLCAIFPQNTGFEQIASAIISKIKDRNFRLNCNPTFFDDFLPQNVMRRYYEVLCPF